MAELKLPDDRCQECGQQKIHFGDYCNRYTLILDGYELSNLRWLLQVARSYKHKEVHCLDTGDWCGQILNAIENVTLQPPNVELPK